MEILSGVQLLQELCKSKHKYGMFVDIPDESVDEIINAAIWFDVNQKSHMRAWEDGHAFLFFDTEEEMNIAFEQTVGDNFSSKLNSYSGPVRVYAIMCDSDGNLKKENCQCTIIKQ